MIPLATDWATISSLGTAGGTLVLAIATFMSVRSANRSARIAEIALQEQRRPLLTPSRLEDPVQKIMFVEGHWVAAEGGHAAAEQVDGVVYLAMSLRNVGAGIGVCRAWRVRPNVRGQADSAERPNEDEFRGQVRDLYVPAGDIGMWQGALRNPDDELRARVAEAIDAGEPLWLDLLYSDQVGHQRTISRFALMPTGDVWLATMNRHWYLDWTGPRPETELSAAAEVVRRDREAAELAAAARSDGDPD